jgi:hypothetical protein
MRLAAMLAFALSLTYVPLVQAQANPQEVVLEGSISGAQNKTYFEVPFDVPAGIHRISVDFSYTGKKQRTAMDLGIADPERFRGTSGGNKSHFTIAETDATPSYLAGAILPGKWKLLISVPNIRPSEHSQYRAKIRFNDPMEDSSFTQVPLATGARWFRGDLHMHTAHSDGSCASQSGKIIPCPVFLTVQSATARGLDFIAITDHNTDSHYEAMRELQPYFDKLLFIPGREITTFWGHFNIFGVTQFVDYRADGRGGLDVNGILRDVKSKGGIASINHAESPGGEICMGCKWEQPTDVDMSLFTGVEVINGGRVFLSSASFWDSQLAKGVRLTAIGGSDNHNAPSTPGTAGAIAWPTTVVEASELSVSAILDAIRRGRAFIDLTASHDRLVDIEAKGTNTPIVQMGGTLDAGAGDVVTFHIQVAGCPRSAVHLFLDGGETSALPPLTTQIGAETLPFQWTSDGRAHWLRAEVRDSNGSLVLVSSPIYIRPAAR